MLLLRLYLLATDFMQKMFLFEKHGHCRTQLFPLGQLQMDIEPQAGDTKSRLTDVIRYEPERPLSIFLTIREVLTILSLL